MTTSSPNQQAAELLALLKSAKDIPNDIKNLKGLFGGSSTPAQPQTQPQAPAETQSQAQVASAQPLTRWQRFKNGIKEGISTAIHSVPRTLLFSGIAFGGSYAMHHFTGMDPLSVTGKDASQLAQKLGSTVLLASGISSAVGFYQGVTGHGTQPGNALAGGISTTNASNGLGKKRVVANNGPTMNPEPGNIPGERPVGRSKF